MKQAFEDKNFCGAIFLDLTAAYDTVWHLGLQLKLLKVLACQLIWLASSWNFCTRDPVFNTPAMRDKQVAPSEPGTESHKDLF